MPPIRRRFSLLGEGDTGSPRRRFLALDTAFSAGARSDCEVDATGWKGMIAGRVSGSGEPSGVSTRFPLDGVANRFGRDDVSLLFPLLLTGEKGL